MLVLNRFAKQSFYMFLEDGTRIQICLLDVCRSNFGKAARIGIDAPQHVHIVREELLQDEELEEEEIAEEGPEEVYECELVSFDTLVRGA